MWFFMQAHDRPHLLIAITCLMMASFLILSQFVENRERSLEFIVQGYLGGPDNVSLQETGPFWKKFEEALSHYEHRKWLAFFRFSIIEDTLSICFHLF